MSRQLQLLGIGEMFNTRYILRVEQESLAHEFQDLRLREFYSRSECESRGLWKGVTIMFSWGFVAGREMVNWWIECHFIVKGLCPFSFRARRSEQTWDPRIRLCSNSGQLVTRVGESISVQVGRCGISNLEVQFALVLLYQPVRIDCTIYCTFGMVDYVLGVVITRFRAEVVLAIAVQLCMIELVSESG